MGRGVVLHLLARLEVVLPRRDDWLFADAGTPAEGGEGRVGQLYSRGPKLLMDPDQISLAGIEELQDLPPVWLGSLRSVEGWRRHRVRPDHLPDYPARDL